MVHLTEKETIQGWHQQQQTAICNYCQKRFNQKDIENHLQTVHGGKVAALIQQENKYNTLTENQQHLFLDLAAGLTDQELAAKYQVSSSTIRQQKYRFREKAKQAQLYLAQYHSIFGKEDSGETFLPVPTGIKQPDARFKISETEYQNYVAKYLEKTQTGFTLKQFPKGQKKILALLYRISEEFLFDKDYTNKEVDTLLAEIYPDYLLLKRYLIEYQFIDRTPDGSRYWRIF